MSNLNRLNDQKENSRVSILSNNSSKRKVVKIESINDDNN